MPAKYLMSWKPESRRWKKMHRGVTYIVSCRQLGAPETKEGSWRAANEWWLAKKQAVDRDPGGELDAKALKVGRAIRELKEMDDDEQRATIDSILGKGAYANLAARRDDLAGGAKATTEDRTVAGKIQEWRATLLAACNSGQISAGRYEAYMANIAAFSQWVGPQVSVDLIDEPALEAYFAHLSSLMADGSYAAATAHGMFLTVRQFLSWMIERRSVRPLANIASRRFRFNQHQAKNVETFKIDELRAILEACGRYSEAAKLYVLVALNIGAYQMDIAELRQDEVDWDRGVVTRARTKTRGRGGQVVAYQLWPETFSLLKKHRAKKGPLVLTSGDGNPLARRWLQDVKTKRYDLIRAAWNRVAQRMGVAKHRLGMKHLRKTSASILAEHPQYKYYIPHFLAHAPATVADRSYVVPSEAEFTEALAWLRVRILGPES